MSDRRCAIGSFLGVLLCCTACSLQTPRPGGIPAAPGVMPGKQVPAADKEPFLYVAGKKLSKYELGSSQPIITVKLTSYAIALALDDFGNLFVAEAYGSLNGRIEVYDAHTLGLLRVIETTGYVAAIAADRLGYLYAASAGGVVVFPPGGTRLVYHLRPERGEAALAFDDLGDLYAAGTLGVAIYAPSYTPGRLKFVRDIRKGADYPDALALGPDGDLFVANAQPCDPPCGRGSVAEYSRGGSEPALRITNGARAPNELAVDSQGDLYVANTPIGRRPDEPGWVSVYAPGGVRPIRRVTDGIDRPQALALDPSQNLYVADFDSDSVSVYSPGGARLLYRIRKGIEYASTLIVGSP